MSVVSVMKDEKLKLKDLHDSYELGEQIQIEEISRFFCLLWNDEVREQTSPINVCRCDERLKTKDEESTWLGYTGLVGELEHLKTKTSLIDEKFVSVMGEYVSLK